MCVVSASLRAPAVIIICHSRLATRTSTFSFVCSCVLVSGGSLWRRRRAAVLKKLLFLDLLPDLFRRSWVQSFHLVDLLRSEPRQLANEVHEMPRRMPPLLCSRRPRRH